MKKATIIFTFILITIFSIGSFFVYTCYLSSYQNAYQAYAKSKKNNLLTSQILINPAQLYTNSKTISWEDDNKEVVINGVLYDVVSVKLQKGEVVLTVLSDKQEQEIKNQFASTYDVSSSKSSNSPIKLLKQFLAFKFVNNTATLGDFILNTNEINSNTKYTFCITSVFLSQETPPPNLKA